MLIINLIIRDFNVKVHDDLIIMFIYKILVFIAGITTYIICRVLYTPDIFSYSGKDFWIGAALSSWWVILLALRAMATEEWEKRDNIRYIQESIVLPIFQIILKLKAEALEVVGKLYPEGFQKLLAFYLSKILFLVKYVL